MNPNDAAKLLAVAAAFDNRKPDTTSAQAWALALQGRRVEDCQQAIVAHYQTSTEWIMPAHVIAAVKKTRTGRLEDVAPQPPKGLDPDDTGAYAKWLGRVRQAIADGIEVPDEDYAATRHIGELRHVLRAVPAIEAKPSANTPEHQAAREAARAELANRPEVPVADPLEDPPTRAPEPPEPSTPDEQEAAGE